MDRLFVSVNIVKVAERVDIVKYVKGAVLNGALFAGVDRFLQ
jgi:hypothetical protein